ncbi:hypothetical protein NDU88_002932 [Pleurodeles waltl]|uniref:Uncharacterized protein n=1 Tax=Pleurodeles waltl TaxID=8319 RepID=A0AAV7T3W3_PLEWA|nr:hypothetical protein NDU88_002932 [Pleurodeles waltl]
MDVRLVTASEGRVVIGVMVMVGLDEDVVHAGVDATEREVGDDEEGDTVEAVDVAVYTANGLPPLNVRCDDSLVIMLWA